MSVPAEPKIYHIVHVDRLSSIIQDGCLWCDAEMQQRGGGGTSIGMNSIKQRRLTNSLTSRRGLRVGGCVPFYFCSRSIMLYLISMRNHLELTYHGGQVPIVHLEADLRLAVAWAEEHRQRWAFTLSNAGAGYFEDRCDLAQLDEIDWDAVHAADWRQCKDGKQSEFLMERRFPWCLVSRIGVGWQETYQQVMPTLENASHKPRVEIEPDWYY